MSDRARFSTLLRWIGMGTAAGVLAGAASALFLTLLDAATHYRQAHENIIYTLPLAGLVIGSFYERYGQSIQAGNNLVIDTIHDHGPRLPLRMAPMVLIGTVLTHLFGGSAGREGTAVQMGASLGDALAHRLGLTRALRQQLLAAGVAGGFGSVFGTPIAGAVFGLEFVVLGRLEYKALIPALVAAISGDLTARALGIQHTDYPAAPPLALSPLVLGKWLVFAVAIALASAAFIELLHALKKLGKRLPVLGARMFVGGVLVVLGWRLLGTSDYLGLGVPTILRAFTDPTLPPTAFLAKIVFTAVTLGAGFMGGEVTPLFFIGATLGNTLSGLLGLPLGLGAAVGLAAMFAACANTPLALSIMAVELCGANALPHVVIVSSLAYVLVGQRGIYSAQRLLDTKSGTALPAARALRDAAPEPTPRDAPGDDPPANRG